MLDSLRSMPRGVVHVGIGLAVLGLSTYGFLSVSAHAVSPTGFASLSVLYTLTYTVGPGVFLPYEQEVARALSDRRARGLGAGPLLRHTLWSSGVVVLVIVVACAALGPVLVPDLFDHSIVLLGGLLVSVVGLAAAYVSRGVFAGTGQFGVYGAQLAVEGGSRFLAAAGLALAGVGAVGPYGIALAGAFLISVLCTARPVLRFDHSGPDFSPDEFGRAIRWMIVGALLSLALLNAGPVAVKLLAADDERAAAGTLLAGLILARLPLFLFAAIQAALLPSLATVLATGEVRRFTAGLRRTVGVVVLLTGIMALVLAAVGPEVMEIVFGRAYRLGRLDLVVLGVATGVYIIANVLGNGLLALQRFPQAAAGWSVGAVAFAAVVALPVSLLHRVEYSFLVAAGVVALAFAHAIRRALHRRQRGVPVQLPEPAVGP